MSKSPAQQSAQKSANSWTRCLLSLLLVVAGIVWIVVYINYAKDAALFNPDFGGKKPSDPTGFMAGLGRWNFAIGFGMICVGLSLAAHPSTPLGRGRGVVIGMLGCFLFGQIYIVIFYFVGNDISKMPLMKDLDQYNLVVGVAFMAVGFTYATRWE